MRKGNPELNKKRGERVRAARKRCNITQEALADMIPCSINLISSIENGRRGLSEEFARKFGEIFDVDPDFLLCNIAIDTKSELLDAYIGNVKHSPISQIVYDLIKAHPDCRGIRWQLDTVGASWDIEALLVDTHNMDVDELEYIHIRLRDVDQIALFNKVVEYLGPQLFRFDYDRQFLGNWHFDFLDSGGEILFERIEKDQTILRNQKTKAVEKFRKPRSKIQFSEVKFIQPDQADQGEEETNGKHKKNNK